MCVFSGRRTVRRTLGCQASAFRGQLPRGNKTIKPWSTQRSWTASGGLTGKKRCEGLWYPLRIKGGDCLDEERVIMSLVTLRIEFLYVVRSQHVCLILALLGTVQAVQVRMRTNSPERQPVPDWPRYISSSRQGIRRGNSGPGVGSH